MSLVAKVRIIENFHGNVYYDPAEMNEDSG